MAVKKKKKTKQKKKARKATSQQRRKKTKQPGKSKRPRKLPPAVEEPIIESTSLVSESLFVTKEDL